MNLKIFYLEKENSFLKNQLDEKSKTRDILLKLLEKSISKY